VIDQLKTILVIVICAGSTFLARGQQSPEKLLDFQVPYFTWGKGIGITSPDSAFTLNIRFRMQNRFGFNTVSGTDLTVNEVEARVRRLRLRFDGYLYNPRLTYVLQLSFSRGDIDFEDTGFPNVVRDAMLIYNFNKHFALGIGQTKLPGNRQRVVSSGDLQLPARSIVNSIFNVDRDFGIQSYYRNQISGFHFVLRGSVSSGDGRNFNTAQRGLAYTGRVELLPLGQFQNSGDYFEGDLSREPKPKISVGLTWSNNENAIRTGGQLGKFLFQSRDIETFMTDFLLKYRGFAFSSEFLNRMVTNPITTDPDDDTNVRYVYDGHGENYQASYLFRKDYEYVNRYSRVRPGPSIRTLEPQVQQFTLGLNKYLRGHRVKLQTEFTYELRSWMNNTAPDMDSWLWRFQIEAGI
jgi:phosphate-selective porin OprO and OprP